MNASAKYRRLAELVATVGDVVVVFISLSMTFISWSSLIIPATVCGPRGSGLLLRPHC